MQQNSRSCTENISLIENMAAALDGPRTSHHHGATVATVDRHYGNGTTTTEDEPVSCINLLILLFLR